VTRAATDPAAVELADVTIRRGGRTILSGLTAAIAEGEFIGLFGPNGAGKTTLLRAILGLMPVDSGRIAVMGAAPVRGNPRAGYLPQERSPAAGLRLSGWNFVASAYRGHRWGPPLFDRAARREIDWALDAVGADALATRVVSELSGGEFQRLMLAAALLGRPRLLLLDEPLISLDPHRQRQVVELVARLRRELGMTVIFSAHELNPLLGAMDRVLYLGYGRGAIGTVDEVITGEVLSRLYDTPIEVMRSKGRIFVLSGHGEIEADAHRHA
jgi:zinc/manganese transport system ATP-binding protein